MRYIACKYFLSFCSLPFHFVNYFICCAKAFWFDVVPLVYFCFCCLSFLWDIQKIISKANIRFFPRFSSSSFTVLVLTFRSLIHFEFIFVYGRDRGPIFSFCIWISSFLSTIYLTGRCFSIVSSWCPC